MNFNYTCIHQTQTLYRLLLSISLLFAFGQTASAQVLLSGTSFDPLPGNEGRAYIRINDIVHYGLQPGSITAGAVLTPNVNPGTFNSTFYYAVTDNPSKLDAVRYANSSSPDYQVVFSPAPLYSNYLDYKLNDLLPGSSVEVRVTYCSPIDPSYPACDTGKTSFRGIINAEAYSQYYGQEFPSVKMGACSTFTLTSKSSAVAVVDALGNLSVRLNSHLPGNCKAISISKIEILGTPRPIIEVEGGNEACVGDQVLLQSRLDYNANYQWQVNSGTGWSNISGAAGKSLLYELKSVQEYQFRVLLSPTGSTAAIVSEVFTLKSIACCPADGITGSRQTVFYDDFGRVDLRDSSGKTYIVRDYSDPSNPKEASKSTTTPFRWELNPAPLGAVFKGIGAIEDGEYTVAGVLTGRNDYNGFRGARLEWANAVTGPIVIPPVSYDHSGKLEGAALFINCPPNTMGQTLYSRTLSNLCAGKQLYFECWIAVFTQSANGFYNGVNVNLKVTDNEDTSNTVIVNGTATREADGGGVWVRLTGQIVLKGTSATVEIINNQNVSVNGNDLVIDDLKIMACSAPASDLFFNSALAKLDTICDAALTLDAMPSDMLKQFYGSKPYYLFQYSADPKVLSTWKNVGSPQAQAVFSMADPASNTVFIDLRKGDKVYFRVVTATSAIFAAKNNFQGAGHEANINDPCRNYSVSTPIEAVFGASNNCSLITGYQEEVTETRLLFHPNPTKDLLHLTEEVSSAIVINAMGEQVLQTTSHELRLGALPAGIYQVLAMMKNGKTVFQKVVKE